MEAPAVARVLIKRPWVLGKIAAAGFVLAASLMSSRTLGMVVFFLVFFGAVPVGFAGRCFTPAREWPVSSNVFDASICLRKFAGSNGWPRMIRGLRAVARA